MGDSIFVREFEIPTISESLNLYQKIEGDVSCVVWDASIVLAKYLEKKFSKSKQILKGRRVVELGAGLGCAGLAASCLGATVLSSDLPECIPLLDLNISKNEDVWSKYGDIKSKILSWGDDNKLGFTPDQIILADCVYYEESVSPLIKTLVNLAGPETEILLSQEMRESETQQKCWKLFVSQLEEEFDIKYIPLSEQHDEFCSPDIVLLHLTKRFKK